MWRLFLLIPVFLLSSLGFTAQSGIVWRSYRSGAVSATKTPKELVIQNQGAFDNLWRDLTGDARAPRDVDFTQVMLVAVQLGERPSGGYKVVIRNVERTKPNVIKVTYEEQKPAPGSPNISMMTTPWDIVTVERKNAAGTFIFEKRDANSSGIGGAINLGYRTYLCDTVGGGQSEYTRVIRDMANFSIYWRTLARNEPVPNDIDWNSEMIAVIHLGTRASSGYEVLIDCVEPFRGGLGITYIEKAPSEGQRVKNGATSPYLVIRLPRLPGDVQFRKRVWRSDG